jgi:hypothetical protein
VPAWKPAGGWSRALGFPCAARLRPHGQTVEKPRTFSDPYLRCSRRSPQLAESSGSLLHRTSALRDGLSAGRIDERLHSTGGLCRSSVSTSLTLRNGACRICFTGRDRSTSILRCRASRRAALHSLLRIDHCRQRARQPLSRVAASMRFALAVRLGARCIIEFGSPRTASQLTASTRRAC